MLKRIYILLVSFCVSSPLIAQEWEFGGWVGGAGYIGDLNPNKPLKFTDLALGANIRYGYSAYSGLKLSFAYGNVRADDANSEFEQHRLRNLNFRSPIIEAALLYEFYFYQLIPRSKEYRITPYVFTGIAGFMFEPSTEYQGNNYKLRELGTEGQGTSVGSKKKYGNIQMAIPFGVGIKYNFASNFNIGLELGYRNTFTDYLDDVSKSYVDQNVLATTNGQLASDLSDRSGEVNNGVDIGMPNSQRGDKSKRDFYMFTGLTLSYTLTPIKCPEITKIRK
jgi:hypothetical protein